MAQITKQQEFDELSKFGCAFLQTSNYGGYCIVVDDGGEAVLWRECIGRKEHTAQRWQRIKWTCPRDPETDSRPYFTIYGRRYYLDEFMHVA